MKIVRGQVIKVLCISYRFTDKFIDGKNLGNELKKYYETNSRGYNTFEITNLTYRVPFHSSQYKTAVPYVRGIMPQTFDCYVHFVNPKTSRYGHRQVITYASRTNVIHEFGHFLRLSHANQNINGNKIVTSKDPFSQMTIFSPYPSLNPVHRYQLRWFLPGELVVNIDNQKDYVIAKLKNFRDRRSAKVVFIVHGARKYFISYGDLKGVNYVCIHTIYGKNSSFLIGMYRATKGGLFVNNPSGITIKVEDINSSFITLNILLPASENDLIESELESDSNSTISKCSLGQIDEDIEDFIDNIPLI
jgi:hypothetical protein